MCTMETAIKHSDTMTCVIEASTSNIPYIPSCSCSDVRKKITRRKTDFAAL